ncbi:HAD hydrolase-like protein [Desulfohalobiaceae bacterium Ax17]|jgi:putative hydrolase of the HAD superfamily|uniref:HAD family hydrolase n=1 Tax=Desulfovulcanus ferrireducens TaxID=2831190 RepID=UPI00207BB46E|nr:HAD family hydrolase [Desulfovulcanus ferrireducens]MBT8763998.1 HAD hydrolase-like protein [Desulfovulcanus ferrireducens]
MDDIKELCQLIHSLSRPLNPIPTNCPPELASLHARAVIFDVYGTMLVSAAGDIGTDTGDAAAGADAHEHIFWQAIEDAGLVPSLSVSPCPSVSASHFPRVKDIRGTSILQQLIKEEHNKKQEQGIDYPEVNILDIWRQASAVLGIEQLDELSLQKLALAYELRVNPVWPMPGLKETLGTLQQRGIVLGIISNAQFYTPLILETLLHASLPDIGFQAEFCIWSYEEGMAKPSVNLFSRLQKRLQKKNILPHEVLYVGNDMLKDIWPAMHIGWKTALFAGDRRSLRWREGDERVTGLRPRVVINDLRQLCVCLDRKYSTSS